MSNQSYSFVARLHLKNVPDVLSNVTAAIAKRQGNVGAIDTISSEHGFTVRDITIHAMNSNHADEICSELEKLGDVSVVNVSDRTFLIHLGGKIEVKSKIPITNRDELSMAYTPGVARICTAIHEAPEKAHTLTIKHNTVAMVSDGTAVLGLGDIGPLAALPVMEGKAMLFKDFAGVDAFPICLDTKDVLWGLMGSNLNSSIFSKSTFNSRRDGV